MGNHDIPCEFCGKDQRGLGAECRGDCFEEREARRKAAIAKTTADLKAIDAALAKPDLKVAWEKFRVGDALGDAELGALIRDIEVGIPFLENRGETGGVLYKALIDRETLRGYKAARSRKQP